MGSVHNGRYGGGFPLTPMEKKLAEWVETRPDDLRLVFSVVYPGDDDEWEAFGTADLCVEQKVDDLFFAQMIQVDTRHGWPESWEHIEKLARSGLERQIEERTVEAHKLEGDPYLWESGT